MDLYVEFVYNVLCKTNILFKRQQRLKPTNLNQSNDTVQ